MTHRSYWPMATIIFCILLGQAAKASMLRRVRRACIKGDNCVKINTMLTYISICTRRFSFVLEFGVYRVELLLRALFRGLAQNSLGLLWYSNLQHDSSCSYMIGIEVSLSYIFEFLKNYMSFKQFNQDWSFKKKTNLHGIEYNFVCQYVCSFFCNYDIYSTYDIHKQLCLTSNYR